MRADLSGAGAAQSAGGRATSAGQASAEFIIVLTILMFLFLVFYAVYIDQTRNLHDTQLRLKAQHQAYALGAAVNYVYLAGEGATLNYTIPYREAEGNLTLQGGVAESLQKGAIGQSPLLQAFQAPVNISGDSVLISNADGGIAIGQ